MSKTIKMLTIGCSNAPGVPMAFCKCPVCTSKNPKNSRARTSMMIYFENKNILIDTPPEIKQKILSQKIQDINSVIITHPHADHASALFELTYKSFTAPLAAAPMRDKINLYASKETMDNLKTYQPFIINDKNRFFNLHVVEYHKTYNIHGVGFRFFPQAHGEMTSSGIKFGNTAYCTDIKKFPEESLKELTTGEIEILYIEGMVDGAELLSHSNLDEMFAHIDLIKAKQNFSIHMSHQLEYEALVAKFTQKYKNTQQSVMPAYDGMIVSTQF